MSKKCNNGQKCLYCVRKNNDHYPVVYLDEGWENQNNFRIRIWQNEEETDSFKILTGYEVGSLFATEFRAHMDLWEKKDFSEII